MGKQKTKKNNAPKDALRELPEDAPAEMQAAPIDAYGDSLSAAAAKARSVVPHLVWARQIDEDTGAAIMLLAAHADPTSPVAVDDAPAEPELDMETPPNPELGEGDATA